jgi:hypothetical protein
VETILTLADKAAKTFKGKGELAGMTFAMEPYTQPKGNFLDALSKFTEKYPRRKLRKGEKGAAQLLRETRDRH